MVLLEKGEFRIVIEEETKTTLMKAGVFGPVLKEVKTKIGKVKILKHRKLIAEGTFEVIHDYKVFTEFLE